MAAGNENAPVEICELLLRHGADPEALDKENQVPLDVADERGGLRPQEHQHALRTLLRVSPRRARARVEAAGRHRQEFRRRMGVLAALVALVAVCLALLRPGLPLVRRSWRMHIVSVT